MTLEELENYVKTVDSRYRAVILAAKRAKQLQKALRPLFEGKSAKVTTMALDELVSKKVEMIIEEPVTDDQEKAAEEPSETSD